ncbi:MAG: formylmethanofuran--tetrahydromethanopterin N-formyltransferase [Crenarchaeota archaeon]|nr:formylmethanofuran--tetrahydromethanopterin N-formyltransferase [Thermoproteota archaeon]
MNIDNIVNKLDDTFAEAFPMYVSRVLVTADSKKWALIAGKCATGFATSIILSPCEAGIEKLVRPEKTPDKRIGVLLQFWHNDLTQLKLQLILRLSQVVLTCPTTRVFDGLPNSIRKFTIGSSIARFGDGFERRETVFGRDMWIIPVMDGEFMIENKIGVTKGVAGGNIIILGRDRKGTLEAAWRAASAIRKTGLRVILPFPGGVCRAGSKVGSRVYKKVKATTNHPYCPTLKDKIPDTKLSKDVECVYEIVINGLTENDVKLAMGIGAIVAASHDSVIKVTCGNYGGKLGPYKLMLKEAVNEALRNYSQIIERLAIS